MLCSASDTFRILVYSDFHLFRYIQSYSCIFKIIKAYSRLPRCFKEYSGIFSTLCNPVIFTALPYSEPWHLQLEAYSKPFETLSGHIQNPAIVRTVYPSTIQPYSGRFKTLCNSCICRYPAYLEFWNIQNPSIIAFRRTLRTLAYLRK